MLSHVKLGLYLEVVILSHKLSSHMNEVLFAQNNDSLLFN